jgi:integrase
MHRNREQKGSVVRIGEYWCVRYADWQIVDGQRIRKQNITHKLAPVLPEHARLRKPPEHVEPLRDEFMREVNAGRNAPERSSTITQFVEDVWFPFIEKRHAFSTVSAYRFYWKHILKPWCGHQLLRDFRTPHAQALLDQIARKDAEMRRGTLHKLKSILSAVFKLAIQQDYRQGPNPIRETTLPKAPGPEQTHAYDLAEIRELLGLVPENCRPIIALAAYAGLSRSEIQGLMWEGLVDPKAKSPTLKAEVMILSSFVRGKRGAPKTKARQDSVPLIRQVRAMLELHWEGQGSPTAGVMFPTAHRTPICPNGTPICLHNLYEDHIKPVLEGCAECGKLPAKHRRILDHEYARKDDTPVWRGWHAFRRGLGTNLHQLGVDDKTIQAILRHSNVAVTQAYYIKTRPQQVVDAMAQLEAAVVKETTVQ